jgi:hypothetical protein
MGVRSVTPLLNVSDIGESFEWFDGLGWKRCEDPDSCRRS